MKQPGIYAITCAVSGEQYVGSSRNIRMRWNRHKGALRGGNHENRHLQFAWNKYGENAFLFTVIEIVENLDNLIDREQFYFDTLQPAYNIRRFADTHIGFSHTPESIEKIRTKLTGQKRSEEVIQRMREAKANVSDATRTKQSIVRKGKVPWALVEASANARRGKSRPQEVSTKILATRKERFEQGLIKPTQRQREHAKAQAEANRGRKHSQTSKDQISATRAERAAQGLYVNYNQRPRDEKTGRFLKST